MSPLHAQNASQQPAEIQILSPDVIPTRLSFNDLDGWAVDQHMSAFEAFRASCVQMIKNKPDLRLARPPSAALIKVCQKALHISSISTAQEAKAFFEKHFTPYRITPASGSGFMTGYYEPEVEGSLTQSEAFPWPLRARPSDLITIPQGETRKGLPEGYSGARLSENGSWQAYPDRDAIENGAIDALTTPLLYVRDEAEAFSIQVQGSARIRLVDGRNIRVAYAGRNGHPYTSIGKRAVEKGYLALEEATMDRLMAWLRANPMKGQALMRENRSFVFFRIADELDPAKGPLGAASVQLTPERSLAVDRNIWSYGLPVWIDTDLSNLHMSRAHHLKRLMVAQDTGSAIVGAARADYFVGSGENARLIASRIRHPMQMSVLVPHD